MRFLALLFAAAAALLVAYGAWCIYQPAGFIVGGLELFGGAYMLMEYAQAREAVKK
jgi:hypothetical protein